MQMVHEVQEQDEERGAKRQENDGSYTATPAHGTSPPGENIIPGCC
jgi:hypothetical protein